MPPKSFEEKYETMESENRNSENFIFPKKSSETKKAIDKADKTINESVKTFANNLDEIKPGLTGKLLNIFKKFEDKPEYKGLSESDLWLHSLGELYKTGEIPYPLGNILNEMMQLLNEYKTLRYKSQTLYDMLSACACLAGNENSDWDISGVKNQAYSEDTENSVKEPDLPDAPFFKPAPSCNRWGRFS